VAECVVCGAAVPVSDACAHCARPVCGDHREPARHDCPGVDSDSRTWYTDPDAGRETASGGRELSNPRRLALGVGVAVLVALVAGGVLAAAGTPALDGGLDDERLEARIVAEANDARTARGFAPLAANDSLAAVADAHSGDMAARGYVNHTAPNGSGVADRYARFGLECLGSENIYYTPNGGLLVGEAGLAERVVAEWLASPGHRETLLSPAFTRQGIGVAVGPDDGVYVTQNVC
jgi:uncharacterized protein YkwD